MMLINQMFQPETLNTWAGINCSESEWKSLEQWMLRIWAKNGDISDLVAEGQPEAGAEDSQVQRTAAVEAGGARGRGGSRHRRGRLGGARRSAVPVLQGPGRGPGSGPWDTGSGVQGPGRGACEHVVQPPRWEPPDSIRQDFSRLTWTLLIYPMTPSTERRPAHHSASSRGGAVRRSRAR